MAVDEGVKLIQHMIHGVAKSTGRKPDLKVTAKPSTERKAAKKK